MGGYTLGSLAISHASFQPDDPGMPSVAYTWGQILARLKGYVEMGTPQPYFVQ